jgi:hypothetical protein
MNEYKNLNLHEKYTYIEITFSNIWGFLDKNKY